VIFIQGLFSYPATQCATLNQAEKALPPTLKLNLVTMTTPKDMGKPSTQFSRPQKVLQIRLITDTTSTETFENSGVVLMLKERNFPQAKTA
jgi:hypothetical protein